MLKAGARYINSVAHIPPSPDAPKGKGRGNVHLACKIIKRNEGYAVTGGQDTVINVFSLETPKDDPDFSLVGHTENVCALDVTSGGTIISGSWDK